MIKADPIIAKRYLPIAHARASVSVWWSEGVQMTDWLHLFFSPKGRINRAKYILVTLLWAGFGIGVVVLAHFTTGLANSTEAWILVIVLTAPALWSSVIAGIKRLHDRNKTGLWMLLFYLGPYILDNAASSAELHGNSAAWVVAEALNLAITLWAFVELACLRGTIGPNQYGDDPVTKEVSPGATTVRP
jgi:uncharacterized membrane protein YhaH (DUF805 family)